MQALDRALLRDFARLRAQVVTLSLVVAAGATVFVAMKLTVDALEEARGEYYRAQRLADLFDSLKRAPLEVVPQLAAISGVAEVEGRVVGDAPVFVGKRPQPATVRFVSLDLRKTAPLNALRLRRGRAPVPERDDEVVLNEPFAEANHLDPGSSVAAVLNGRLRKLRVVGVGISPEFVFQLPPGVISPNDERYGVAWMARAPLEAAFDMRGAFNDVVVRLAPGAMRGDVIAAIDRRLAPFGGHGAYGIDDQLSAKMLDVRIKRIHGMLKMLPTLFLLVAAFVLNVVLGRLVEGQREQLGALKAFGYSNTRLGRHYLQLALLIVVPGAIVGVASGLELGHGLVRLFTRYFRLPLVGDGVDWAAIGGALLVVLFSAVFGALAAVRKVTRLHPVEAMRPPSPPVFHRGLIERLRVVRRVPAALLMVARNLKLAPTRALASIAALAFATALCVTGSYMGGALDALLRHQFDEAMREDLSVAFVRPLDPAVCHELAAVDGIVACEPLLAAPVRARFGAVNKQVLVTAPPPNGQLRRIIDRNGERQLVPPEGLMVSQRLLDDLGAGVGDALLIETVEGLPRHRALPVTVALDDELGLNMYASLPTLRRFLGESPTMMTALLRVAPGAEARVVAELSAAPAVVGVSSRAAAIADFEAATAQSMRVLNFILAILSAVLAVAVVYNGARVALQERSRDLASLRVLGFTRGEVWRIVVGEMAIAVGVGVPLGLLLGYWLASLSSKGLAADEARIPFVITPATYAFAAVVVLLAALISAAQMRRLVQRLDLVEVLKTRE
jgi:putative ABC transport system permease protein